MCLSKKPGVGQALLVAYVCFVCFCPVFFSVPVKTFYREVLDTSKCITL